MDVIDRLDCLLIEQGVDELAAHRISGMMRQEYCGGLIYVPKKSEAIREQIFDEIRQHVPRDKIVKRYGISKTTVYRMTEKIKGIR